MREDRPQHKKSPPHALPAIFCPLPLFQGGNKASFRHQVSTLRPTGELTVAQGSSWLVSSTGSGEAPRGRLAPRTEQIWPWAPSPPPSPQCCSGKTLKMEQCLLPLKLSSRSFSKAMVGSFRTSWKSAILEGGRGRQMRYTQTEDDRLSDHTLRPPISKLLLPPLQMAKLMKVRIKVSVGELQNFRSHLHLSSETWRYSCPEVLKQAS